MKVSKNCLGGNRTQIFFNARCVIHQIIMIYFIKENPLLKPLLFTNNLLFKLTIWLKETSAKVWNSIVFIPSHESHQRHVYFLPLPKKWNLIIFKPKLGKERHDLTRVLYLYSLYLCLSLCLSVSVSLSSSLSVFLSLCLSVFYTLSLSL